MEHDISANSLDPMRLHRLRQHLLWRIHRHYETITDSIDVLGRTFSFTRIADPNRVLDQVAEEEDRQDKLHGRRRPGDQLHLPYWAELWDSALGMAQFLTKRLAPAPSPGTLPRSTGVPPVSSASDLRESELTDSTHTQHGRDGRATGELPVTNASGMGRVPAGVPAGALASPMRSSPSPGTPGEGRGEGPTQNRKPKTQDDPNSQSSILNPQSKSVLDLGCGMGFAGTVAAAMGCRVLFADLEAPALLFARLNSLPSAGRVRTRRLNWRTDRLGEWFDLILGADILYERAQWEHLERFWRRHLAPGGSILLGEPGRQTGDIFPDWIRGSGWTLAPHEEPVPTRSRPIRIFELKTT